MFALEKGVFALGTEKGQMCGDQEGVFVVKQGRVRDRDWKRTDVR